MKGDKGSERKDCQSAWPGLISWKASCYSEKTSYCWLLHGCALSAYVHRLR